MNGGEHHKSPSVFFSIQRSPGGTTRMQQIRRNRNRKGGGSVHAHRKIDFAKEASSSTHGHHSRIDFANEESCHVLNHQDTHNYEPGYLKQLAGKISPISEKEAANETEAAEFQRVMQKTREDARKLEDMNRNYHPHKHTSRDNRKVEDMKASLQREIHMLEEEFTFDEDDSDVWHEIQKAARDANISGRHQYSNKYKLKF